ncbi:hypothetical protein JY651_17155 [Pyxidicoccus parkwayensis]|uniref:Uncharacterized protein n=1 Tax=Pyxidicoccus parkwayensis TaxID=2813578 RepID=A0ABX7P7W4_9BACT|nr:hypothetical protein [Pyxidicoccus parkwaysis]QSQ26551.1 hypothetical protein JY651_17155 [Pyxidicoccus parkwaysis]
MHRILSLVVAVGLSFAPSAVRAEAEKAQTFQFVKKAPAVGDSATMETRVEMKLNFAIRGPGMEPEPMDVTSTTNERYTSTVLAVRKGLVDRVKVAFGDTYQEATDKGKTARQDNPLSGKVYVAAYEKGRVVVTDGAGKPVPEAERASVASRIPNLGKVNPLEAALPDKPIRVGDSLDRFAQVLAEKILQQGNDSSMRFSDTQVRLAGVTKEARGAVGTLHVTTKLTIKGSESPITMTVPLEGTITALGRGAKLLELTLSGPMTAELEQELRTQGLTVGGQGELKMSVKQ